MTPATLTPHRAPKRAADRSASRLPDRKNTRRSAPRRAPDRARRAIFDGDTAGFWLSTVLLLLLLALVSTVPAAAQGAGSVDVRFLDQPVEDLAAYAEGALATAPRTAGLPGLTGTNELTTRTSGASDVLLVPYFEVDRRSARGVTTLFAVRNETSRELEVRILYLAALGAAEQHVQEISLAGHATYTVNLRDVPELREDEDGIARGLVILGVVGTDDDSSALLSGDFFYIDPATDYATGNTLLGMSLDRPENDLCTEWSTRFLHGGPAGGRSAFRFVVDYPSGNQPFDPPTAVGTVYDQAGEAQKSFEVRTDLNTFELTTDELIPEGLTSGSISIRFPDTKGALLVEHSGLGRLAVTFRTTCRDAGE